MTRLAKTRTHRVNDGTPVNVYVTSAEIDGVPMLHIRVDSEGETKLLPALTVPEMEALDAALGFEKFFGNR